MPEEEKPKSIIEDPLLASLAADLGIVLKADAAATGTPTPAKIEPVVEGAPATVASPKAAPDGIKANLRKRETTEAVEAVVDRAVDRKLAAAAKANPPATLPSLPGDAPKDETAYIATLPADQQAELADAAYAEGYDATKFKGMRQKMLGFYRKLDAWVEEQRKEGADHSFDENDQEFVAWVKSNKPDWAGNRDTVRIERIADTKAAAKLKEHEEKQGKRFAEVEATAREAQLRPAVERTLGKFSELIDKEVPPTDDPLEKDIGDGLRASAVELAGDYLRLIQGLDTVGTHNPQDVQQRHNWLVQFVTNEGVKFSKTATPEQRVRAGRQYITPEGYARMQAAKDPKIASVWTLTAEDVLETLAKHTSEMVKTRISEEVERQGKRGFVRSKPKQVSEQKSESKPVTPTRATPSAAPGAAGGTGDTGERHLGHELIDALELLT